MLDPDFARSGFSCVLPTPDKVTRFQVIGERSSGTNYVKRLLGRNTDLTPVESLGWKHGFPQALAIPPDLLVIGVVRRADDWARSMHSKPWHATPALQSLPFSEFIRAPWDTIIDRPRYFEGAREANLLGQPLMQDRDPLSGARFANLFALRAAKLDGLLGYFQRDCNMVLLRMEEVTRDPQAVLARLRDSLGLPPREGAFRPVVKRLGSKFKAAVPDRPQTPNALTEGDLDHLRQSVRNAQENALGYAY